MKLLFVGTDGSMGLRKNHIYDCEIYSDKSNEVWVKWKTATHVNSCPYSSLHNLLQNWVEVFEEKKWT